MKVCEKKKYFPSYEGRLSYHTKQKHRNFTAPFKENIEKHLPSLSNFCIRPQMRKKSDDDGFFLPYIHSHLFVDLRVALIACNLNCRILSVLKFFMPPRWYELWLCLMQKERKKKNIYVYEEIKEEKKCEKCNENFFLILLFIFYSLIIFCLPFAQSVSCMRSWDSWKREDQQLSWRKNEGKNHHFAHTHIWQSGSSTIHLKNPQHNLLWAFSWMDVCCCCCSLKYVTVVVEENDVEE